MWGEVGRGIGKDRLANEWHGRAYLLSPGRGKIVVGTQNTDGGSKMSSRRFPSGNDTEGFMYR